VTDADLLDFTHKYRQVRGFSPRRAYLTYDELLDLLKVNRHVIDIEDPTKIMFDGAFVRRVYDPVCSAIRAWDLLPYGSDT
jgi:hypothetical protein